MSDNVVQLFGSKPKAKEQKVTDPNLANLIGAITDWAEANGIDVFDYAFQIRCADFVTQLQIMANDSEERKIA